MGNFVELVNFYIYYEKLDIYCLRFEYVSYILSKYYIGDCMKRRKYYPAVKFFWEDEK